MIVVSTYSLSLLYEWFLASMVQHSAHFPTWPPTCRKMQVLWHNYIPTSRNHYPTGYPPPSIVLPPTFFLVFIAWAFTSHTYGIFTAMLSKFEPYSWLLFGFKYCKSSSPTPYSIFCNSEIVQNGTYGSNEWSLPIVDRCYMFSQPFWLLCRWSLVLAVALGRDMAI